MTTKHEFSSLKNVSNVVIKYWPEIVEICKVVIKNNYPLDGNGLAIRYKRPQ